MVLTVDFKKVVTFRPYKNHIPDHRHGHARNCIPNLLFLSSPAFYFCEITADPR